MNSIKGLVAYPSTPSEIGNPIKEAVSKFNDSNGASLLTWEENSICGQFVAKEILSRIDEGNILVADITKMNFNVIFEIGYAIGKGIKVAIIFNKSLNCDFTTIKSVGVFDTIGYSEYVNSIELASLFKKCNSGSALQFDADNINRSAPAYLVLPKDQTDDIIRIKSRIKKARLRFRSYDPEEQGRLSATGSLQDVACSLGVIVPLLGRARCDAEIHNYRAAYVAGLATGMGKLLLLLQAGEEPVPLDYRELVNHYKHLDQINEHIAEFATGVTERLQEDTNASQEILEKNTLAEIDLGASAAENEIRDLDHYYLQTDEYRRTRRGEIQVVTGRKGSGKTAIFVQVRDRVRTNRKNIVLDLKPEGYQLIRFKELVLSRLESGTREHTISAFWEYLILLEICHKVLDDDQGKIMANYELYEPYQELAKHYLVDTDIVEGDFAERMLQLTERISQKFQDQYGQDETEKKLDKSEVTDLIYKHDIYNLRRQLLNYLEFKNEVWILFDNIDKGWPPRGVREEDVIVLRSLIDALGSLKRSLTKHQIDCYYTVFVRNDVYELLLSSTADRGKISHLMIDWTDPDLLREVLRKRLVHSGLSGKGEFDDLWLSICESHIDGEESSQYLIDRCLMRPRNLIDLLQHCKSRAINLSHDKIGVDDFIQGEKAYSTELINNIGLEMRDVFQDGDELLYLFVSEKAKMKKAYLFDLFSQISSDSNRCEDYLNLLLWYGILGVEKEDGEITYIYSTLYDIRKLKALIEKQASGETTFCINPAFWAGLDIT